MYDVIVCGSNAVDVFIKTDAEIINISGKGHGRSVQEKLLAYPLGSKIIIESSEEHIGGGGTNALATFVRQELSCAYIGKVGEDTNGHKVFEWLKENNIEYLGQVGESTGYSIVLDSEANDRTILNFRGANNSLDFDHIPQHMLKTKWFYGSGMQEQSYETLKKLFTLMKRHRVRTAFNTNCAAVDRGIDALKELLTHLDVFILNKEEAQYLVRGEHPLYLAKLLAKCGPKIVVVTDGEAGATVHVSAAWDGTEQSWHIAAAKNVHVVETTGAGDAFSSAFIAGLAQGKSTHVAAQMAILNAESVITRRGAKEYIPTKQELASMVKKMEHTITPL